MKGQWVTFSPLGESCLAGVGGEADAIMMGKVLAKPSWPAVQPGSRPWGRLWALLLACSRQSPPPRPVSAKPLPRPL